MLTGAVGKERETEQLSLMNVLSAAVVWESIEVNSNIFSASSEVKELWLVHLMLTLCPLGS